MAKDLIRYDLLVHEALKGVLRKVLADAARDGLPGEHYFYITFRTEFPGVRLSKRQREKFPEHMTIVLQHQFWDLTLTDQAFEVGLSFGGIPERLLIPFDAVTQFQDLSVPFGLKFELQEAPQPATSEPAAPPQRLPRGAGSEPVELPPNRPAPLAVKGPALPAPKPPPAVPAPISKAAPKAGKPPSPTKAEPPGKTKSGEDSGGSAEVVSLDSFRKKS